VFVGDPTLRRYYAEYVDTEQDTGDSLRYKFCNLLNRIKIYY
jgi:hypothetical protein